MISESRYIALIIATLLLCPPAWSGGRTRWKVVSAAQDSILQEMDTCFNQQRKRELTNKLYALSRRDPHNKVLMWRAVMADAQTDPANSQRLINIAESMIDTVGYEYDHYRLMSLKASRLSYTDINNYYWLRQSLDYYIRVEDLTMEARSYVSLGVLFAQLHEYSRALGYLQKANDILKTNGPAYAYQHNLLNMGYILGSLGRKQEAYKTLRQLENYSQKQGERGFLAGVYCSMYMFAPSLQEAERTSRLAVALGSDIADHDLASLCLERRADYCQRTGATDSALVYARRAWSLCGSNVDIQTQSSILRTLAEVYHTLGNQAEAYKCLSQADRLSDSLQSASSRIADAEVKASIARYELAIEQHRLEARWRTTIIVVIAVLLLLVAVALALRYFIRWRQGHRTISRTLGENERLKSQVEQQGRQLTSSSLRLQESRNVMHDLESRIALARREGSIDNATQRELRQLIHSQGDGTDWNAFETYFNNAHPHLLSSLQQAYPTITATELRHCCYVRIGLDIKETARLLNVQPDSIRKARQRLRRKLGVSDPKVLLADFLKDFEDNANNNR